MELRGRYLNLVLGRKTVELQAKTEELEEILRRII